MIETKMADQLKLVKQAKDGQNNVTQMLLDMTMAPAPKVGQKASLLPISFNDTLFLSPNLSVDSDFEILTLNLGKSKKENDRHLQKFGMCIINEEIKKDKGLTNANYF